MRAYQVTQNRKVWAECIVAANAAHKHLSMKTRDMHIVSKVVVALARAYWVSSGHETLLDSRKKPWTLLTTPRLTTREALSGGSLRCKESAAASQSGASHGPDWAEMVTEHESYLRHWRDRSTRTCTQLHSQIFATFTRSQNCVSRETV